MAPMRMRINKPPRLPGTSRTAWAIMRGYAALLAGAVIALSTAAGAAEVAFSPRVSLGQHWTDNVTLAPKGTEESEWITELKPGFSLTLDRPRATAEFDYDLQALWYADNSDFNDAYHQARGKGTLALVPQSLFLDAFTRFNQQNVDPGGPIDFSNLFITNNRTDAFVYGASPYHSRRWGNWADSLLRYAYQAVNFTDPDEGVGELQDSNTQSISGSLESPAAQPGLRWRAFGGLQITEFDEGPNFEYARATLDFDVPVGPRVRATMSVGRESDVEKDRAAGELDATLWYVGFEWEPSELQQLSARGGERYYGTAWELHWTRLGSFGEVGLNYTEEPTTSTGMLGDATVFEPDWQPGVNPGFDTRIFLRKSLVGHANYKLARTTFGARIYADRIIFQENSGSIERYYGVNLIFDWQYAPRTALNATIDFWRSRLDTGNNDNVSFNVGLTRQLSRALSGVLRVGHQFQNAVQVEDYTVNWISLGLTAQF